MRSARPGGTADEARAVVADDVAPLVVPPLAQPSAANAAPDAPTALRKERRSWRSGERSGVIGHLRIERVARTMAGCAPPRQGVALPQATCHRRTENGPIRHALE